MGRRTAAFLLAGLLAAGCGGSAGSPTGPPSTPPITLPPAPPPTTLPPASQGCGLPASGGGLCRYDLSAFVPDVQRAIARVEREQPELFDFTQRNDELSVLVRDQDRYHEAVVKALRDTGLCAIFDGEEVAVKNTNDFSDQYDIITSNGFVRWGDGAYAATCQPAAF